MEAADPPGRCFPDLASVFQAVEVGFRTPHAQAERFKAELALAVGFLVDLANTNGIFECHAVGALEIKETRARSRMTAGAEDDRDIVLFQKVIGPHHVICGIHLVIDVLKTTAL